jgi:hypothetical protein
MVEGGVEPCDNHVFKNILRLVAKLEMTDVTTELLLATNSAVAYVNILPGELDWPARRTPWLYVTAEMFENGYNKASLIQSVWTKLLYDSELSIFSVQFDPLW